MKQRLTHETAERMEEESSVVRENLTNQSLDFETPEAMLRHDAAHTIVPPQVRDRVMESVARETRDHNPAPWWKRWMPF